ncbi:HEXXH motif-containing putative peptide modification protein [Pendulispora brunnea]|uniref:HEXXH motif-containing putative peptide modification protein n=1 Tax=Pendulispora brunnea TaxID=2905690 RepID=A0ABZ2JUY2_9BACT
MLTPSLPSESRASLDDLAQAERALSTHAEFGDSIQIETRVLARYRFGLEVLAEYLPSLRDSVERVNDAPDEWARHFLYDPGLRLAIENALAMLERKSLRSPDLLEAWLPAAWNAIERDPDRTYSESAFAPSGSVRVGPGKWSWVAPFDQTSDPLLQPLRRNLEAALPTTSTCLATSPWIIQRLDTACSLLGAVLPQLGASTLRHIAAISVIETKAEEGNLLSASGGDVAPSTMVVSPRQLENPWDAAGHLLHEGLHLKLFDVARSHALLRDPDERVEIPWRQVPFTLSRVVFSFHVYVHMLLFKAAVERRGARYFHIYGEPRAHDTRAQAMSVVRNDESARFGRAIDRTRFLYERLSGPWSSHLTRDGLRLVEWLTSSVERIEGSLRPPSGERT